MNRDILSCLLNTIILKNLRERVKRNTARKNIKNICLQNNFLINFFLWNYYVKDVHTVVPIFLVHCQKISKFFTRVSNTQDVVHNNKTIHDFFFTIHRIINIYIIIFYWILRAQFKCFSQCLKTFSDWSRMKINLIAETWLCFSFPWFAYFDTRYPLVLTMLLKKL